MQGGTGNSWILMHLHGAQQRICCSLLALCYAGNDPCLLDFSFLYLRSALLCESAFGYGSCSVRRC
jgi:hypothetical protein